MPGLTPTTSKRWQRQVASGYKAKLSSRGLGDENEETENEAREQQERANDEKSADGNEAEHEENDEETNSTAASSSVHKSKMHPQKSIDKIWQIYNPQYLGKVTRVLPEIVSPILKPHNRSTLSFNASTSYKQAREQCLKDVQKIVDECYAVNEKYTDVHFDLESDLKVTRKRDCIDGLVQDDDSADCPFDVKRVTDIYENPQFFSQGAGSDDIIQGGLGDCWLLSGFSVLTCREELIHKICVARDQDVGVYGFVFFRDGEWHPTIIDDKLFLSSIAFDESVNTMLNSWGQQQEQKYTELFQRGSRSLYFAKCRDQNETWVPLLEKAFAKAHGGYDALRGGQTGEAVEDLTGGVTTEIYTTNILSKDRFWNELRKIGKEFLFDASDPLFREWIGWDEQDKFVSAVRKARRRGVVGRHAYAVLDTYEGHGERLVKVRNPWGQQEWDGAWSDGSPQWTAEWLTRLNHQFGDDGVFWMNYKDFLHTYRHVNRTRLFDDSWFTAQQWASLQVPFSTLDYQQTKFEISVPEDTDTVIVLSQLDSRYFSGLEGKYDYRLQFRISSADNEDEYIARSGSKYELERSTNVERRLKAGKYSVLIKVEAQDMGRPTPDAVIKSNLPKRKDKVTTIGRLYDLAHQKGLRKPETEGDTKHDTSDEAQKKGTQTDEPESKEAAAPDSATADSATPATATADQNSEDGDDDDDENENEDEDEDDDDDDDDKDPWNASCVVGLRVYSKSSQLSVKVIWPPKPKKAAVRPAKDRDDITKAAQDAAEKTAEDASEVNEKEDAKEAEKEQDKKEENEEENDDEYEDETEEEEEEEEAPKKKQHQKPHGKKHPNLPGRHKARH